MTAHERAQEIRRRYEAQREFVRAEIRKLFPSDAVVRVGGDRPFSLRVTRHDWSDPFIVHGTNLLTGKRRRFYAGSDTVTSVQMPRKEGPQ